MNIRELAEGDIASLSALAKQTYAEVFGGSLSESDLVFELEENRSESYFRQAMSRDVIIVLEDDHEIVGYVQFGDVSIPDIGARQSDQQLRRLYLKSTIQGKGWGRKLMVTALAHARLANACNIYLQVWDENSRAVGLYKSLGFKAIGKTKVMINKKVVGQDLVMVRSNKSEFSVV